MGQESVSKPGITQPTIIQTGDGDDQVYIHTNRDGSVDVNINGNRQSFSASEARDLVNNGLVINTGDGDDTIVISGEQLQGSENITIQISSGDGNDTVSVNHGRTNINAGAGDDNIYGSSDSDVILGGLGSDTIWGRGGNDIIDGGHGVFTDRLYGGDGDDRITDQDGFHNKLSGGQGNDVLIGGVGSDILSGGDGDDVLVGGRNNGPAFFGDQYDEGAGNDRTYHSYSDYVNSDDYPQKKTSLNAAILASISAR
jgi:Ca2+-binding RTX toxin-like protein